MITAMNYMLLYEQMLAVSRAQDAKVYCTQWYSSRAVERKKNVEAKVSTAIRGLTVLCLPFGPIRALLCHGIRDITLAPMRRTAQVAADADKQRYLSPTTIDY